MSQAYAAGCNIVILASDFQRVQIILSAHGDVGADLQVFCISCCSDSGKVRYSPSQPLYWNITLSAYSLYTMSLHVMDSED